MTKESVGKLWPADKIAVYASEQVALEYARELNERRDALARESFRVRHSRVDERYWEVYRYVRSF